MCAIENHFLSITAKFHLLHCLPFQIPLNVGGGCSFGAGCWVQLWCWVLGAGCSFGAGCCTGPRRSIISGCWRALLWLFSRAPWGMQALCAWLIGLVYVWAGYPLTPAPSWYLPRAPPRMEPGAPAPPCLLELECSWIKLQLMNTRRGLGCWGEGRLVGQAGPPAASSSLCSSPSHGTGK